MAYSLINKSFKLNIPNEYYAAIIGKNGVNIKRIREQYNVNVIFPNRMTNEEDIIINGIDQQACLNAK
jgi:predicted PilT family ATPase